MRNRRGEEGMALLAAMLFAVAVLAWISSILTASVAVQKRERYRMAAQQAMAAAESGVHAAVSGLNGPGAGAFLAAGSMEGVLQGTGAAAPRYSVTLVSGRTDGIDNDVDGAFDEADEADMVEASSTGRADRVARTVQVTLMRRYRLPPRQGALQLGDPSTYLSIDGSSSISGSDADGQDAEMYAIAVYGDTATVAGTFDPGLLGSVSGPGLADSFQLYEDAARNADLRLQVGVNTPSGTSWGTEAAPRLLYGTGGEIELQATGVTGVGILVVDGDLVLSGDFVWRGLLVVSGDIRLVGGSGTGLAVYGTVVSAPRDGAAQPPSVILTGNVQVQCASTAVATTRASVADRFTILNWREAANPGE